MMFVRKSKVRKMLIDALLHESNEYKRYAYLCEEAIELRNKEAYNRYKIERQSHFDQFKLLDDVIKELNLRIKKRAETCSLIFPRRR